MLLQLDVAGLLADGIAWIAVAVIGWGVLLTVAQLLWSEFTRLRHRPDRHSRELIRRHLAYYILLSMEFLIAADMIRTIRDPSLQELATLAVIVAIRSVSSYFLSHEEQQLRRQEASSGAD